MTRCGAMRTLREILGLAQQTGVAIGHFNVADIVLLKAVFTTARQLIVPVIVGASEGERKFVGVAQLGALVRSLREEYDYPIFLNADHTHSFVVVLQAARYGFDAVGFDASALPFELNVQATREAVEALRSLNPDILVEGEIGDIGSGSEIHAPANQPHRMLTSPLEARQYVEATGVDILAPAVGNQHGMLPSLVEGTQRQRLDTMRIAQIKQATAVALTLHGGSGTDDSDLREAIAAGINIIHINTELRLAWRRGLEAALARAVGDIVPYRVLPPVVNAVSEVVLARQ